MRCWSSRRAVAVPVSPAGHGRPGVKSDQDFHPYFRTGGQVPIRRIMATGRYAVTGRQPAAVVRDIARGDT